MCSARLGVLLASWPVSGRSSCWSLWAARCWGRTYAKPEPNSWNPLAANESQDLSCFYRPTSLKHLEEM